jgi:hypothetical protein
MPNHHRRRLASLALSPALAFVIVGCSSAGAPSAAPTGAPSQGPSQGPSTAPSTPPIESPAAGSVDHKTGSTEVLLRYEEGGGFVMPAFLASQAPHFTLYGDGTVIFRNPMLEPPPAEGSVGTFNPMRTAKLTEVEIQELLVMALGEGGLAIARPTYENNLVADASTAIFTIEAGGIEKTVSVYALGMDVQGGADAAARAAFQKLAQRLTDFDQGGTFETAVYEPEAYRAVLIEAPGVQAPDVRAWPWPDLKVSNFKFAPDPNGLQLPHRTMTASEIEKLQVTDFQGGFQGLVLTGPDGKSYTFSVRPLLPDDNG